MNWKDIVKKDKGDSRLTSHRKKGKKQMKEMYGDSKDPYGKPEAESLATDTRMERQEGVKRTMPLYPIGDGDEPVDATRRARERAKRKKS